MYAVVVLSRKYAVGVCLYSEARRLLDVSRFLLSLCLSSWTFLGACDSGGGRVGIELCVMMCWVCARTPG